MNYSVISRAALSIFLLVPNFATADVNLICKGSVVNLVDLSRESRENSILDIKILLKENISIVRGSWGCPLLAVPATDSSFPCARVPVLIDQDEIKSSRNFQGSEISGSYSFVLNRNSGILKTTSVMRPVRNTNNFNWFIYTISGEFECEVAAKKF